MNLGVEATEMLRAGRVLRCRHPEVSVRRSRRDGYVLIRHTPDGAVRVRVKTVGAALHLFREEVGRRGLMSALDAHRYAFLFPNGSSLDWRDAARGTLRRATG
jgi:hypothetical protein